ncbi:oligomeric golgi complex component, COG2-domain-containing protein [Schizophyllum amplum]|uniref:Conserved oligomeric Golgi complex subunit 2 n=1 Tax=Schizophyllum amplum TaxID=97359 RepID=A0A550CYI9_9AGAR|nr:oligomeric golgi complex component, COG2-domain-containing protein [Auriculariopsis ampla]
MASSADPFDLDRLAEELVAREEKSGEPVDHDLPLPLPLSHDNPYLTAPTFNVEEFLLSRVHTSLPELRTELREYMATLKEELVRLINDDYEAFISLSTDLQGEGTRLERLKFPLGDIKAQILESKDELSAIQAAIQEKLQKRAVLREEKTLLHLLLKISESMTRLESLLSITSEQESSEASNGRLIYGVEESPEDKDRANQAKHLSRVAAEYNQLLYHVNKARSERCVFVDQIQWRIDRIQSSLSSDLDHLFSTILSGLVDGTKVSEINKAKWTSDLTECLRTYDMLCLWRDAEDILRRDVVRAYVKKAIYPGALAAPPSPLVPHTPFATTAAPSFLQSIQPPRTPYTPYTALHNRTSFAPTLGLASSSPWARSLEALDDPLAKLYIQVIRFVERDLCRIMDIAERVSIKPLPAMSREKNTSVGNLSMLASQPTKSTEFHGFEIMANVVWAEIGNAIIEELGTVVFAAGRPNEFRKNHEMTQAFVRAIEVLAPSEHAVEVMRKHPVYMSFERRWQLPVYFQLRWKEIISKLEESLSVTRLDKADQGGDKNFATIQARAVWEAISACWSAEIYIPDLSHRFWRLTLQLLSRYKTWLDQALAGVDESPTKSTAYPNATKERRPDSPSGRASTPAPPTEAPSAESIAADDAVLRHCSIAMVDIRTMEVNVMSVWQEQISMLLPEYLNDDEARPGDALEHSMHNITSLLPMLASRIVSVLVRRCSEALLPVRSIPSQFRAMSNKRVPSEASYFIPTIFRPVKTYFGINTTEGPGSPLKDLVQKFAVEIFETVAERYGYYVTAMRKTEESLRRLKKGRKTTFSLFGGNAKDDEGRDEERIRTQMILDVEAFGREGEVLGVDIAQSAAFRMLDEMVHREEAEAQLQ